MKHAHALLVNTPWSTFLRPQTFRGRTCIFNNTPTCCGYVSIAQASLTRVRNCSSTVLFYSVFPAPYQMAWSEEVFCISRGVFSYSGASVQTYLRCCLFMYFFLCEVH